MNSPKDKIISTVDPGVSISGTNLLVANNAMIKRLWGKNIGAATIYIQIFDSVALPAPGADNFIMAPLEVAVGLEFNMDFSQVPLICENGISVCASINDVTLALVAGDDLVCTMQYADKL